MKQKYYLVVSFFVSSLIEVEIDPELRQVACRALAPPEHKETTALINRTLLCGPDLTRMLRNIAVEALAKWWAAKTREDARAGEGEPAPDMKSFLQQLMDEAKSEGEKDTERESTGGEP